VPAFLTTPADADTSAPSAPGTGERPEDPAAATFGGLSADHASLASTSGITVGTQGASGNSMEHYERLQRRLLSATALAIAAAVPVSALLFDVSTALSLLLGGAAGLLYLRLLARSVSRLGGDRRSVGKVQLLVPVALVLAAARIPALQLLPALLGFLLYKPALIVQALLDP